MLTTDPEQQQLNRRLGAAQAELDDPGAGLGEEINNYPPETPVS